MTDPKQTLKRYLQLQRDAMVFKLEGLSERDIRRPMTPTGTNLLGLLKHLGSVEFGYFGEVFGRQSNEPLPWADDGAEPNADMWATPDQSRQWVTDFYRRAWAHSDATIDALELDAIGRVPWWPATRAEVTLHQILVHVTAETARHAGHADIVRELIDGSAGIKADNSNLPDVDAQWWSDYVAKLQSVADDAAS
jgi:Protein of unknown function (DUF664).